MQKKPAPAENDDNVKLKPVIGMRPGVYLTIIYSFALILIVFLFLFLPGLVNPRAALIVKTEPAGAAIRVNDTYMGLSGSKIIVPKGTHTIEAVMPGFEKAGAVHKITSRVFGSLFFPKTFKIEFEMTCSDPAAAFAHYAGEFAEWTFMGEPTSSWQIPLVLSDGAYRTGAFANDESHEILKAASRFAVTQAALRDLIRAKALLDNRGGAPSAAALLNPIKDALVFLSQTPNSALWLCELLPEYAPEIADSAWFYGNLTKDIPAPAASIQRRTTLAGISFIEIQSEKKFYVSENPISQSLFENFLNENPQWRDQKNDYYPDEISINPIEMYRRDAVTGISWHSADAFCKWLSGRLPSSMSNMEARLPSEDEWLAASLVAENMKNTGWEWCDDFYAPLPLITAKQKAVKAVGSPEKLLRGRASPQSAVTRASLPPEITSPFVTFRPVIAEKE